MIYLGCDHGGFELKKNICEYLQKHGVPFIDCGNTKYDGEDNFPDYVEPVVGGVLQQQDNRGILICGTGIGVSIMANHYQGIRAALVHSADYAKLARQHNNANILCLGGRFIETDEALKIVDIFLTTPMDNNPKYQARMARACKEL
ncbi:MAG: RpiB/LacA/LacB family sugar-phosphate isomerase [Clostridia bacterium]|nr:RpiB/LacA/LacB family sugar-phosphate isomerase [Clostridia bacterium]